MAKPDMSHLRIDREGNLVVAKGREPRKKLDEPAPHHEWSPYDGPIIWTGPDGLRDYRPKLYPDWQYLGIGQITAEKTLSSTYISRATKDTPFPKPKSTNIGEIGWFYNDFPESITRTYPYNIPR